MSALKRAITTYDGRVYTHRILFAMADRALMRASADARDFDARLTAALFSALAFEAYLNLLIEQFDLAIFAKERDYFTKKNGYAGPRGKIRWVLKQLRATPVSAIESSRRRVLALLTLRDELAHTKPISYAGSTVHSTGVEPPPVESQWVEERTELPKVRRYVDAVRRFCEWLNAKAAPRIADPHLKRSAFDGVYQSQVFSARVLSVATRPPRKGPARRTPLPK